MGNMTYEKPWPTREDVLQLVKLQGMLRHELAIETASIHLGHLLEAEFDHVCRLFPEGVLAENATGEKTYTTLTVIDAEAGIRFQVQTCRENPKPEEAAPTPRWWIVRQECSLSMLVKAPSEEEAIQIGLDTPILSDEQSALNPAWDQAWGNVEADETEGPCGEGAIEEQVDEAAKVKVCAKCGDVLKEAHLAPWEPERCAGCAD